MKNLRFLFLLLASLIASQGISQSFAALGAALSELAPKAKASTGTVSPSNVWTIVHTIELRDPQTSVEIAMPIAVTAREWPWGRFRSALVSTRVRGSLTGSYPVFKYEDQFAGRQDLTLILVTEYREISDPLSVVMAAPTSIRYDIPSSVRWDQVPRVREIWHMDVPSLFAPWNYTPGRNPAKVMRGIGAGNCVDATMMAISFFETIGYKAVGVSVETDAPTTTFHAVTVVFDGARAALFDGVGPNVPRKLNIPLAVMRGRMVLGNKDLSYTTGPEVDWGPNTSAGRGTSHIRTQIFAGSKLDLYLQDPSPTVHWRSWDTPQPAPAPKPVPTPPGSVAATTNTNAGNPK